MALIVAWCLLPVVVVGRRIVDIYQQFARVLQVMNLSRIETLDFSFAGTVSWITRAPLTPVARGERRRRGATGGSSPSTAGWRGESASTDGVVSAGDSAGVAAFRGPSPGVHAAGWTIVTSTLWWDGRAAGRRQQLSAVAAVLLYLVATVSPILTGPLFFAALIAFGVALMSVAGPGPS